MPAGFFSLSVKPWDLTRREWTPLLMQRIVYAAAETRSFARAAVVLRQVGGNAVSPKTIQRITHVVGNELAELSGRRRKTRPWNRSSVRRKRRRNWRSCNATAGGFARGGRTAGPAFMRSNGGKRRTLVCCG